MPNPPSPAQRAVEITFVLKGDLKNVQLAYLRVAALLAKVRDDRLFAALKHPTMEDYAAKRLGLQRASVYRYLQIYDWVRDFHAAWLARKPKGFIPQLTDAYALMWIEKHLKHSTVSDAMRRTLERLRSKALAGQLTLAEFQEVQAEAGKHTTPLRALWHALRAAKKRAAAVSGLPSEVSADLDRLVSRVDDMLGLAERVVSISARRSRKSPVRISAARV
jgi:hypothetical protein